MQNVSDLVLGEQQHGNYVIHTRLIHIGLYIILTINAVVQGVETR